MKLIFKLVKTIFILFIIGCILGGLTLIYAFFVEPHQLSVKTVAVDDDKITTNIKVAVFADMHLGAGYTLEDFDKAIEKINEANVDFVLFAGDLIDNFSTYTEDVDDISAKLSNIKASQGKFAVFGNHDYGGGAQNHYERIMSNGGFKVLVNDTKSFSNINFSITGVDDFLLGKGDSSVVNTLSSNTFNFVFCHEPDVFDNFNLSKVSLMAAGHSHGGQFNVPFFREQILPSLGTKYTKGQYDKGNSILYVNPGLGTTKVKARLFAKPEITIFDIK